jgi:RNA polymerase-binding transcription factor DksA
MSWFSRLKEAISHRLEAKQLREHTRVANESSQRKLNEVDRRVRDHESRLRRLELETMIEAGAYGLDSPNSAPDPDPSHS